MEMETFKKFMIALDKRQKEVQQKMFEHFEKDVVELIKLKRQNSTQLKPSIFSLQR